MDVFMGLLNVVKDATKKICLDFAEIAMKGFLHDIFIKTVVKELVKLCFAVGAVAIAITKPFGNVASLWTSSAVFILLLLFSILSSFRCVVDGIVFGFKFVQERSLSLGIKEFIRWRWLGSGLFFNIYDVTQELWLNKLPKSDDVIKIFVGFVFKDVILFSSIFVLYLVTVHFVFKPMILSEYAGVTVFQLYLFPVVQLLNSLKG